MIEKSFIKLRSFSYKMTPKSSVLSESNLYNSHRPEKKLLIESRFRPAENANPACNFFCFHQITASSRPLVRLDKIRWRMTTRGKGIFLLATSTFFILQPSSSTKGKKTKQQTGLRRFVASVDPEIGRQHLRTLVEKIRQKENSD